MKISNHQKIRGVFLIEDYFFTLHPGMKPPLGREFMNVKYAK